MTSDLEKNNVRRTKRARRCRRVLFQRSTWAVSPVSLPTAACWKRHLRDRGPPESCSRGEAELLFFDPLGHRGARDPKRTGEAAQTAAFLSLRAGSPRGELLDRHWESGSHGFDVRTCGSDRA